MNSEKIPKSYAYSDQVRYGAHLVTLVSDYVSYEHPVGKFVMNYISPSTNDSTSYDRTLPPNNTGNVINSDRLDIQHITTSNYIEIAVPMHYFYITKLEIKQNLSKHVCMYCGIVVDDCHPVIIITRKTYFKGQKFVIVNGGGNVETPYIVGVV